MYRARLPSFLTKNQDIGEVLEPVAFHESTWNVVLVPEIHLELVSYISTWAPKITRFLKQSQYPLKSLVFLAPPPLPKTIKKNNQESLGVVTWSLNMAPYLP